MLTPTLSGFSNELAECFWRSGVAVLFPDVMLCINESIAGCARAAEPETGFKLFLILRANAPIRSLLWFILCHERGRSGFQLFSAMHQQSLRVEFTTVARS